MIHVSDAYIIRLISEYNVYVNVNRVKVRRLFYVALQLPHMHLSGDVVTDRAGVQSRPQPKPAVMDVSLLPHIAIVCRY